MTGAGGGASIVRMAVEVADNADALQACRERYLGNLAALYRKDPDLAAALDALPFAEAAPLEIARDGNATIKLSADDGREVYAHSRHRPFEEAAKFVEQLPEVENPAFVLSGLGAGYHVAELERRHDRPMVIVAEDDLGLIKSAMCVCDFSEPIREGRLVFLASTDNRLLHDKLGPLSAVVLLGLQFVTLPHARRCRVQFHDQIRRMITDFVSFARMQIVTLLKTARVTVENVAYNLPSYLANPGVETLAGRAAGFPAVIVSAGPSLARNLDQLPELRDRAVVIAVQTVLRKLVTHGVSPHFVTSLDFHEISTEFFREVGDAGDCTLVAEPKAAWRVLDMFSGPKRVLTHKHYNTLLRQAAPRRGGLAPGTTVAHLAFYLAQHLGCDPIILVGQDLAFSEGLFYMPGSPIEQTWRPELNRYQTVEMKQWERIVRNRAILRKVKDIHGRDTYADDLLFTYKEQFENDFAVASQRVIQASEGGAALKGADVMALRDAARQYCTRPLPSGLFSESERSGPSSVTGACEQLEARIEELRHVKRVAREMFGLLEKLEPLVEKPAEFNRLIVRVDELRMLIHKYPEMYRLVIDVSATAELRRYSADRQLGAPERETADTARRRLRRDREFVGSFIEGCEFLGRVLPEALRRVREQLA